jgi:hypothetical protein
MSMKLALKLTAVTAEADEVVLVAAVAVVVAAAVAAVAAVVAAVAAAADVGTNSPVLLKKLNTHHCPFNNSGLKESRY